VKPRPIVRGALALQALVMLGAAALAEPAASGGLAALPSNSADLIKERQMRARLSSAGFTDIVNLDQDGRGGWSCRALRWGTVVRVAIDRRGRISIV